MPHPDINAVFRAVRAALDANCALHVHLDTCTEMARYLNLHYGTASLGDWFGCRADLDYPRCYMVFERRPEI